MEVHLVLSEVEGHGPGKNAQRPRERPRCPRTESTSASLIDRIKATPRQDGVDEIRIPSERAFRNRERALHGGIEIDRAVHDALVRLGG
jgi:LDH2 family malate/lactate/ureidoglycolate dehydrogenase